MSKTDGETNESTDDKALPPIRGNLNELKREIVDGVNAIVRLKSEREGVNADKSAIVEKLEAKGINRHALKMAMQYAEMNETKRQNFDMAYELVREAIGEPLQGDLLKELDKKSGPKAVKAA